MSSKDFAPPGYSAAPLTARLDRIPVATRSHKIWIGLLGFLFMFDLADLNTFAYAAPALKEEWGLSVTSIGAVTSAGFVGMVFGALAGGRLSDRFGRRPVLIGAVFFYSAFSLLTAASVNIEMMAVMRVLTGFGLQAMTGVLLVYVSEMFPRRLRGRYQSMALAIGFIGVPVVAFAAKLIVPLGTGTWRWIFVIGALGAIGAVAALRILPESIRWQLANGRGHRAEALVSNMESEAEAIIRRPLPEPQLAPPMVPGKLRDLFGPRYIKRTLVVSVVFVFMILAFYGFNSWIPTLLVERGYTTAQALGYTSILSLAAVPGALIAYPIIDRFERKYLILVIELIVTALMLVFGFVSNTAVIVVSGFLITMLLQTGVAVLYTYVPEIFPTHLRGIGSGIANGSGRVAGIAGGFIVAGIYTGLGFSSVFVYLAAASVLMGVTIALLGERTTNRGLENIAEVSEQDSPGSSPTSPAGSSERSHDSAPRRPTSGSLS